VAGLPRIELTAGEADRLRLGQVIERRPSVPEGEQLAAVDDQGRLVALVAARGPERLRPVKTFPAT
jgi:hypothetical protein